MTTQQELKDAFAEIQTRVQTYPASTRGFMANLLFEREMTAHAGRREPFLGWAYRTYHDLLLELAEGPRVERIQTDDVLGMMEERNCYSNCHEAATAYRGYTYVEGLAQTSFLIVRHAWLEDEHGRIIDPTWVNLANETTATYFGVRFTDDFLLRQAINTGWHSFFEADWQNAHQILRRGLKINDAGFAYDLGDPQ